MRSLIACSELSLPFPKVEVEREEAKDRIKNRRKRARKKAAKNKSTSAYHAANRPPLNHMDQDRQIRFAIPPFFLLSSLLWGAYLSGRDLSPILKPDTAKELFGLLAAAAIGIVPLGFLISSVSVLGLSIVAAITQKPTYEAHLSKAAFKSMFAQIHSKEPSSDDMKHLVLYTAATFDHELLAPGIHAWILRRWNAFMVSINSVVALLLAHAVALICQIPQTVWWGLSTLTIIAVLVTNGVTAWRQTMEMLEFQAQRTHAKK